MTAIETKIYEYFQENENVFNEACEALNAWNGWLNDDEIYPMEMLNEFYANTEPLELLARVFYGHDQNSWKDENGTEHYEEFNPNREYFYYNGYGNLVSCDYKDYSGYLTVETIREMQDEYIHIMDNMPSELDELFQELDEEDNGEEDEEETEE